MRPPGFEPGSVAWKGIVLSGIIHIGQLGFADEPYAHLYHIRLFSDKEVHLNILGDVNDEVQRFSTKRSNY